MACDAVGTHRVRLVTRPARLCDKHFAMYQRLKMKRHLKKRFNFPPSRHIQTVFYRTEDVRLPPRSEDVSLQPPEEKDDNEG